jgi:calcineurin-like phosphoesterase
MPVFAFLGVIQHEVASQQLRRLVDAIKAMAGSGCVVLCNASGLFANAARLGNQTEELFESGIDLVFPGEQSIARGAARSLVSSGRWPMVRPLNLPVESPGYGTLLFDRCCEPFWAISLLDGTGRIPVEPAHLALEEFFRNKNDSFPVLINVHGTDFDYQRALTWKYANRDCRIYWFGSSGGALSASCTVSADGSFHQPEVGIAANVGSISGLAPEIWWQRRIDRVPAPPQAGWGAWHSDCTILWLDSKGKALKFEYKTFKF